MPKSALRWLMIAAMTTGFNASGWAQDSDPGKTAYLSSCAPCHGADGKLLARCSRRRLPT